MMNKLTRIANGTSAIGTVVAALSCAMCFPALASIGAILGLGFLAQYEGVMLDYLLPLFASVALAANVLGYFLHRQWHRSILGMVGPSLVLLTLYPLWQYAWSNYVLYIGLVLMAVFAVADLVWPDNRRCLPESTARAGGGNVVLKSTLTCPLCGYAESLPMPTDACQYFHECAHCHELLKPKAGDCCVFCSYGDMPCPPVQIAGKPGACCLA